MQSFLNLSSMFGLPETIPKRKTNHSYTYKVKYSLDGKVKNQVINSYTQLGKDELIALTHKLLGIIVDIKCVELVINEN